MKIEPVPYKQPAGTLLGRFFIALSPDGWAGAHYEAESGADPPMQPDERLEFNHFVYDFMRGIKLREELDKYSRKHGKVMTPGALSTYALLFHGAKLDYEMLVTGVSTETVAYRPKKGS